MKRRSADAELLTLCGKLAILSGKIAAENNRLDDTMEEEAAHEPFVWGLMQKQERLLKRISRMRPSTDEGLTAYARACRDGAYLCGREVLTTSEYANFIAWNIVSMLAGTSPPSPLH